MDGPVTLGWVVEQQAALAAGVAVLDPDIVLATEAPAMWQAFDRMERLAASAKTLLAQLGQVVRSSPTRPDQCWRHGGDRRRRGSSHQGGGRPFQRGYRKRTSSVTYVLRYLPPQKEISFDGQDRRRAVLREAADGHRVRHRVRGCHRHYPRHRPSCPVARRAARGAGTFQGGARPAGGPSRRSRPPAVHDALAESNGYDAGRVGEGTRPRSRRLPTAGGVGLAPEAALSPNRRLRLTSLVNQEPYGASGTPPDSGSLVGNLSARLPAAMAWRARRWR